MSEMVHLSTLEREYNYTQKAFDDAEAFLAKNTLFNGTSNYGQFKEGVEPYIVRGGACHAGMGRSSAAGYDLIATEVYYETANRPSSHRHRFINSNGMWEFYERDSKVVDGFFNWFVYKSEFGRFILNRDRPSVKQGWIFSTNLPASITQALCIIGRHFYECTSPAFEEFDKMVAAGVPETVAYVTAFNCYFSYYGQLKTLKDLYVPLYGHRMFSCPSDINMLQNFNKGMVKPNLIVGSYRGYPSVKGTSELFGESGVSNTVPFTFSMLTTDKELKEFVREIRGDTSTVNPINNPFKSLARGKDEPRNVTYEEMFKIVLFLTQRGDFK